ncbi:hypothetical protein [Melittangium boletus]|uniref:hypothetical protein n=1 Tax=Melittangium boletus TaxID=83453 RepID=UPI003DA3253D
MSQDIPPQPFELNRLLEELEALARETDRTGAGSSAIATAAKALHFIRKTGKLEEFQDYLRDFDARASETPVAHTFPSIAEAQAWLRAQGDPPYGATVEIAGVRHLVARRRTDQWFFMPAPPRPTG